MRKRDLAILILCAFAIFFSLQHEGDFSFREAWIHLSDEYPIKYEGERLPPPIVADLNGDGKREVLVATHDAKIQVLQPHLARADEGFAEARVLAEVSLLPDKVRVMSGRRAVAMATGVIDRNYRQGQALKQVLVVVTSGWSVMCFDHNLKKLWETNLQDDFPHNAHHLEVAISISNYTIKHGGTGLIIVGGRMEMQPHFYSKLEEKIHAKKVEISDREAKSKVSLDQRIDLHHLRPGGGEDQALRRQNAMEDPDFSHVFSRLDILTMELNKLKDEASTPFRASRLVQVREMDCGFGSDMELGYDSNGEAQRIGYSVCSSPQDDKSSQKLENLKLIKHESLVVEQHSYEED